MINLQHKIVSEYALSEGETMRIDVRYRQETNYAPIIIFCHGFKAYRNWGFIPFVCRQLASGGAIAVNFDFALNGVNDDTAPIQYNTVEFARNTIMHEVDNLIQVINYVKDLPEVKARKNGEIHLIGHSRGGGIACLVANKLNTKYEIINSLSLWNSIATFDRFTEHQKVLWEKFGEIKFHNPASDQEMSISQKYYDCIRRMYPTPRFHSLLQSLEIPVQIIQATEDLVAKMEEAELLHELIPHSTLYKIAKVGHDFGLAKNNGQPTNQLLAILEILKKQVLFQRSEDLPNPEVEKPRYTF
jgi:pimeloyl-ACP methyl ester carboxylesterase